MYIAPAILCAILTIVSCPGAEDPVAIRADVNLVQLHPRVTDGEGHAVLGLPKDAFQLFIDNVQQPITVFQRDDAPVTAGIVVDNSASMGPKRQEVVSAALAFARASNPLDEMFVVHFSDHTRLGLPKGTLFTGSISALENAIAAFDLGGTTAFYDALLIAQSQFGSAANSRKVLLTITDGGDNSSHATLTEAVNAMRKAGIVVYPIGMFDEKDRDQSPQVLSTIAQQTGGEAFLPGDVTDVNKICVSIAKEIREEYTLGFPGAEDGQYHRIRLTVKDPQHSRLEVQTRAGYVASKPSGVGP
jgi:Ca-activated chloride channel family protein